MLCQYITGLTGQDDVYVSEVGDNYPANDGFNERPSS